MLISVATFAKEKAQLNENATETKIETLSISGMVSDILTNETLTGAVVTANGKKVFTDFDGNFSIDNLCSGKCLIKISMISYEDQTVELDIVSGKKVDIKLKRR